MVLPWVPFSLFLSRVVMSPNDTHLNLFPGSLCFLRRESALGLGCYHNVLQSKYFSEHNPSTTDHSKENLYPKYTITTFIALKRKLALYPCLSPLQYPQSIILFLMYPSFVMSVILGPVCWHNVFELRWKHNRCLPYSCCGCSTKQWAMLQCQRPVDTKNNCRVCVMLTTAHLKIVQKSPSYLFVFLKNLSCCNFQDRNKNKAEGNSQAASRWPFWQIL